MKRKSSSSVVSYAKKRRVRSMVPRFYRSPSNSYARATRSLTYVVEILPGVLTGYGLAFSASGIYINDIASSLIAFPNASELSALYDAYRFDKVKVELSFNWNSCGTGTPYAATAYAYGHPWVYTALDHDDGATPTLASILQRDGVRCNNPGENGGYKIIRTFCPKVAISAGTGSSSAGYLEPKAGQWVASPINSFADCLHHGMKIVVDSTNQHAPAGGSAIGAMNIFVTGYFSMKHGQ